LRRAEAPACHGVKDYRSAKGSPDFNLGEQSFLPTRMRRSGSAATFLSVLLRSRRSKIQLTVSARFWQFRGQRFWPVAHNCFLTAAAHVSRTVRPANFMPLQGILIAAAPLKKHCRGFRMAFLESICANRRNRPNQLEESIGCLWTGIAEQDAFNSPFVPKTPSTCTE